MKLSLGIIADTHTQNEFIQNEKAVALKRINTYV